MGCMARVVWPPLTGAHPPARPRCQLPCRESRGQHVRRDRPRGDLVADVALDIRQGDCELLTGEADGVPLRAGPRGAPDAMYVIGRILRQVEVEHVTDIGDVQSA